MLEPSEGFLYSPLEQHYRGDTRSLPAGSAVHLSRMTARIASVTPDGRPSQVHFKFHEALEAPSYAFMRWNGARYEPVVLPAIGGTLALPPQDLGQILLGYALGKLKMSPR